MQFCPGCFSEPMHQILFKKFYNDSTDIENVQRRSYDEKKIKIIEFWKKYIFTYCTLPKIEIMLKLTPEHEDHSSNESMGIEDVKSCGFYWIKKCQIVIEFKKFMTTQWIFMFSLGVCQSVQNKIRIIF